MTRRKKIRAAAAPCLLLLVVVCLFQFVLFLGYVPTASMEPALSENSFILGLRIYSPPGNGDIIVFKRDGALLVKRIVAEYGDMIYWRRDTGEISCNTPIEDAQSLAPAPGTYFVAGDNRADSDDSRFWDDDALVAEEDIIAVLFHGRQSSYASQETP